MKKIIIMLLSCVLVFSLSVTASADDTKYSYGHFYYHDHDGYVSIAGYLGSETDIAIPSVIAGKPVSEIESGAFDNADSAQTITVPDTVVITYPDSFAGADSLQKIICDSAETVIPAENGIEVQYPAVTKPAVTSANVQTSGYRPSFQSETTRQSYTDSTPAVTVTSAEETTQRAGLVDPTQDEDIGDFAYEEDSLPDETEARVTDRTVKSEKTTEKTKKTEKTTIAVTTPANVNETAGEIVTSAVTTTAITVPENIVTVSVNEDGELVGVDGSGAETVLDAENTYATEQQPDGSVKIIDDEGDEILIVEAEPAIGQEDTSSAPENTPAETTSPQPESVINGTVILIVSIAAAAVVIGVIVFIILRRKGN